MRLQDIRYAALALALLAAPACGPTGDSTSAVNHRDTAATGRATHQANDAAPDTRDTDASRRDGVSTGTAGSLTPAEEAMGVGPDGAITMKIQAKYADDNVVKGTNIDVDTANGVVTLKGQVDSLRERDAAEQLARETAGVKRVVNQLKVAAR
jgi:hyperosmotically inducible periplasmic protein